MEDCRQNLWSPECAAKSGGPLGADRLSALCQAFSAVSTSSSIFLASPNSMRLFSL